ncbi:MAG: DUF1080 domain-containing protein [Planctomycetota bacterium]|nr:DUF1080 domain-containing protein [Planctomycetota bacterium]
MSLGYEDTPLLPGGKWTVHDSRRPQPPVVVPGTESSQAAPGKPPSDAVILFDGTSLDGWKNKDGGPAQWKLGGGTMEVVPKTGDIWSKQQFGDCQLHVEWRAPAELKGQSQGRGNSGVFIMGRYEIQVLDCHENPTYPDGTTAAIYGQYPPYVNACRKPGEWHVYDIVWVAPRFDGSRLVSPAFLTVFHNGVLVQYHRTLQGPTQHKRLAGYAPHESAGPLRLQDHGDLVAYRNIWYRPLDYYEMLG